MNDDAIIALVAALDYPSGHLTMLTARNGTDDANKGWIRREWFSGSSNKERLTSVEAKVFQIQLFLAIDTIEFDSTDPQCKKKAGDARRVARNVISKAWGLHDRAIARSILAFTTKIENPLLPITLQTNRRAAKKSDEEDFCQPRSQGPSQFTPMRTRVTDGLKSWPSLYVTPGDVDEVEAPGSRDMTPRATNVGKTPGSSRKLPLLSPFYHHEQPRCQQQVNWLDFDEEESPIQLGAPIRLMMSPDASSIEGTSLFAEVPDPFSEEEESWGREVEDEDYGTGTQDSLRDASVPAHRRGRELPSRQATLQDNQEEQFEYNALIDEYEDAQNLEYADVIQEAKTKQRLKDLQKLLKTVTHLTAVGSQNIQKVMKALLLESMIKRNASRYLLENEYPKKKQEQVVARKRVENEGRARRAARRGEEPVLIPESAIIKYTAPLQNNVYAARAKRVYKEYLAKGEDIPPALRPTSVSKEKVDFLMEWIVKNCQFRPGKTRNVRFKKDKIVLKNLPLYMRYGSVQSLYLSYGNVAPQNLRVGKMTFGRVLSGTTLKGTYNQGLSYFYVDFVDLTKLLLKMLGRLESIIADNSVVAEKRDEAKKWLKHAQEHTEFASLYL
jgi:hypothetical protein